MQLLGFGIYFGLTPQPNLTGPFFWATRRNPLGSNPVPGALGIGQGLTQPAVASFLCPDDVAGSLQGKLVSVLIGNPKTHSGVEHTYELTTGAPVTPGYVAVTYVANDTGAVIAHKLGVAISADWGATVALISLAAGTAADFRFNLLSGMIAEPNRLIFQVVDPAFAGAFGILTDINGGLAAYYCSGGNFGARWFHNAVHTFVYQGLTGAPGPYTSPGSAVTSPPGSFTQYTDFTCVDPMFWPVKTGACGMRAFPCPIAEPLATYPPIG